MPPPGYPPDYAFAPRVREPWINPAKRTAAGLAAAAAAIVLLGAGFLAGTATGDGHDEMHHGGPSGHGPHGQHEHGGDQGFPGEHPGFKHHRLPPAPTTGPTAVPPVTPTASSSAPH